MDDRWHAALREHLPVPDAESAAFWDGAREGKLLIRRCLECGHRHFYPRHHCPECWSTNVEWHSASGRGRVYSYTVVYQNETPPFRDRLPYIVAVIELEDVVRMVSTLIECTPEAVHVGMPVEVVFDRVTQEIALPRFRPRY
jgi:uncharacterized OB-fold protein